MTTPRATYWVDIELEQPLSESNHQEFIESLNDSVNQIVDAENLLPDAVGETAGIRVILPDTPSDEIVDRLSFILTGMKHHGIPMYVVIRSDNLLTEIEIPESALFNRLSKKFNERFK